MAFTPNRQNQRKDFNQAPSEFTEDVVSINRISKKTPGGNKVGFAALAVVGDKKGKVGAGHGKAADVASAIRKAVSAAKKHFVEVPMVNGTIPFHIILKLGAAKVMLKPAPLGSGIIAGGAVRSVVAAAGIQNISSKVLGSSNQASNVYATLAALEKIAVLHAKQSNGKKVTKVAVAEVGNTEDTEKHTKTQKKSSVSSVDNSVTSVKSKKKKGEEK